jgi:hypothetical protein
MGEKTQTKQIAESNAAHAFWIHPAHSSPEEFRKILKINLRGRYQKVLS